MRLKMDTWKVVSLLLVGLCLSVAGLRKSEVIHFSKDGRGVLMPVDYKTVCLCVLNCVSE